MAGQGTQRPGDDSYANSVLVEPVEDAITWRGAKVTPARLVEIFTRNWERAEWDKKNVKRARDFRRGDLVITLDKDFATDHPELSWVVTKMIERGTLEAEQIARATSVLPKVSRVALGERETDDRHAEQFERYMQDWVEQYVPRKESGIKLIEDGSHGGSVLPAEIDLGGEPDYYDRLDERAYKALKRDERGGYSKDEKDKKQRYVRRDDAGDMVPHSKWDRDKSGRPKDTASDGFQRDEGKSQEAHDKARERYLANQQAINVRIIRSMDAVPIWGPGKGREPFELLAIIERRLVSVEDALGDDLGWKGFGNRKLIPQGYNDTRTTGQNGEYYLYTLYCTSKDDDGCEHPLIISCLGGFGTWSTSSRYPSGTEGGKDSVVVIDLYKTHGLKGPRWTWVGGQSSGDDDPYHRTRPWLQWFIDEIMSIEGTTTALKASTALNAYTGYNYTPDAALSKVDPESLLETLPAGGKRLRQPVLAKPGRIATNAGTITPQMAANVSSDAWQLSATSMAHLMAVASGATPDGASGSALLVDQGIKAANQAQVRDGMSAFVKFCGEAGAETFAALSETHKVDWPLASTKKPAVGPDGKSSKISRPYRTISTFNVEWLGDEKNVKLTAAFPSELNLARADFMRALKKDRLASFDDVQDELGRDDAFDVRLAIAKDDLWDMPENIALFNQRVAEIVGNRKLLKILRLKAAQQMQDGGVPGMAQGIPSSMLKRRQDVMDKQAVNGQGGGGSGGPPLASSMRGGEKAGAMNAARDAQQAQSIMQSAPSQQAGAA